MKLYEIVKFDKTKEYYVVDSFESVLKNLRLRNDNLSYSITCIAETYESYEGYNSRLIIIEKE
jgi:hypothetical protein